MNYTKKQLPKAGKFVALAVALLLTVAQFLAIRNDARHGTANYAREATTALPAHR